MDNQTIAMTLSTAALGATLAYLGYNNFGSKGGDSSTEKNTENHTSETHNASDVPTPKNMKMKPVTKTAASSDLKQEVSEAQNNAWGQFWQGEYADVREKTDTQREVKSSFNH
jgi:hypothetical protein